MEFFCHSEHRLTIHDYRALFPLWLHFSIYSTRKTKAHSLTLCVPLFRKQVRTGGLERQRFVSVVTAGTSRSSPLLLSSINSTKYGTSRSIHASAREIWKFIFSYTFAGSLKALNFFVWSKNNHFHPLKFYIKCWILIQTIKIIINYRHCMVTCTCHKNINMKTSISSGSAGTHEPLMGKI